MSTNWGKNIRVSLFGESHGNGIGVNIDGLPSGLEVDLEFMREELDRRATGKNLLTTARKEPDVVEFLSGYFEFKTTGTPVCLLIRNKDQRSKDYSKTKDLMRPSHADYTGYMKYKGNNDYRGGGHFSARLTAPLVAAGAIAKQILAEDNIYIGSHIKSIANIEDKSFDEKDMTKKNFSALRKEQLCVLDESVREDMRKTILDAREDLDSVGGVIETAIINLPVGVGEPFFDSLESNIAHMMFSVPAMKGIEFGAGFDITRMRGSEANDELYIADDVIKTYTNNNGGILGGITNGMPVVFKTAFKPTASISQKQRTVNIKTKENTEIEIHGRHDPCIVPRAVVVVEAMTAIAVLDMLIESRK
jgi:chorismate synthase